MNVSRVCSKGGRIRSVFLRIALVALCVILLGVAIVFGISEYVVISVKDRVCSQANEIADKENIDCVIVLGAGLKADGTPSHMLEDRIKVGVQVLETTGADYILMSGDRSSQYYDEPAAMKEYANNMGVDLSKILVDNSGFSTYESITRVKDEYGFHKVVVITQEYHLFRALYIAEDIGIDCIGVSADLRTYRGQIVRDVREILARVKDFFMCI